MSKKWSDELDAIPLGTAEEERARAKAWMDTAGEAYCNFEYMREERYKLLRKYEPDDILLRDE